MTRTLAARTTALGLALACLTACTSVPGPDIATDATDVAPEGEPGEVLFLDDQKDGDSFVATDGVEYRVGMVNTPERNECGGAEATGVTAAWLAYGFEAEVYAEDTHGRSVARIRTTDGDLGIELARTGFADDRYLDGFRSENPAYAAELDLAFEEARTAAAGLWATCWAPSS